LKVIGLLKASATDTVIGPLPAANGNSPILVAPVTVAVPKYGAPVR
jgi:hypothetical protein